MKNVQRSGILLGIGALSLSALINFAEPVSAQPRGDDRGRDDRGRDDRDRNDRDRDDRGRDDRGRDDRDRDDRGRDDRDNRSGNQNNRPGFPAYRPAPPTSRPTPPTNRPAPPTNRPAPPSSRPPVQNNQPQHRTIEGTAIADQRGNNFTLQVGRQQVRVQVPGGNRDSVNRGDLVRVYGFSRGNEFHAQNVNILRRARGSFNPPTNRPPVYNPPANRPPVYNNPPTYRPPSSNMQTYHGTVVGVRGAQAFDININGRTYNVFTNSHLPRDLSRNDYVRVYGERVGAIDIRNANVVIVTNR